MGAVDPTTLGTLGRGDSWQGVRAVVAGFGPAGFAAADNLLHLGADVTALDEPVAPDPADPRETAERSERAELLEVLGATVRLERGATASLPEADLVVASPDWPADAPLLAQARERGLPVWGEVELAWRLRDPEHPPAWLVLTGTRDTTTAVRALDAVLRAADLRTVAAGRGGIPLVEAVMDPAPYDVMAVGLSAAQLAGAGAMAAESAAVLEADEERRSDHAALGRAYEGVRTACVYALADPATERLVREAEVVEGARAIAVTLGVPGVGMVGLVEDILADRAFIEERETSAAELCTVGDLASAEPRFVADVLAAAALARSFGVPQAAVRDGLRAFRP